MLCYRYAEFILHLPFRQSYMLSLCRFHRIIPSIDRSFHFMPHNVEDGLTTVYTLYQSSSIGAQSKYPASLKSLTRSQTNVDLKHFR